LVEHALLDDLVGSQQNRLRDGQPDDLRGLEVDDQLELCRLLDRQISRLRALQDPVHLVSSAAIIR
jgi:hypothetical protein